MSEVKDLSTMIASRVPIIVIESHDEVRVLSLIAEIAMRQGAGVMEWSVVRGLERGAVEQGPIPASPRFAPPEEALREMARTGWRWVGPSACSCALSAPGIKTHHRTWQRR